MKEIEKLDVGTYYINPKDPKDKQLLERLISERVAGNDYYKSPLKKVNKRS